MVSLKKIYAPPPPPPPPASLGGSKRPEENKLHNPGPPNNPQNLNRIPHYRPITSVSLKDAEKCLADFKREYGEIKSATYVYEMIKQMKAKIKNPNDDDELEKKIEELRKAREDYGSKIKAIRRELWGIKFLSYKDYLEELSRRVKSEEENAAEKAAYINCQEVADLTRLMFINRNIQSKNIYMYTVNKKGNRVNKAEHVFCVIGLSKNADIQDVHNWGENCFICDPWAGIAMKAQDGIQFFEEFFRIDKSIHGFKFEVLDDNFPGKNK